jgi:hypothetical protein
MMEEKKRPEREQAQQEKKNTPDLVDSFFFHDFQRLEPGGQRKE